jgi:hypothetical protein
MAATSAERIAYASKSRKWNSTQINKFPIEFPTEHAENLEWIRKAEEEAVRRRADEELHRKEEEAKNKEVDKKSESRVKWIIIGVVGVIIAIRAWQRYKENTL